MNTAEALKVLDSNHDEVSGVALREARRIAKDALRDQVNRELKELRRPPYENLPELATCLSSIGKGKDEEHKVIDAAVCKFASKLAGSLDVMLRKWEAGTLLERDAAAAVRQELGLGALSGAVA